MLYLAHYDDGKKKYQSHEIYLLEKALYNSDINIFSINPFDICGYGETKEEAFEEFKRKYDYVLNELIAFGKMLFETDVIENDILEVDCFGKPIK